MTKRLSSTLLAFTHAVALLVTNACSPNNPSSKALARDSAADESQAENKYLSKDQLLANLSAIKSDSDAQIEERYLKGMMPAAEAFHGLEKLGYDIDQPGSKAVGQDVDLRRYDTGIRNQGSEGLCTAFGVIAAMENVAKQTTGKGYNLSEQHLWRKYQTYSTPLALGAAMNNYLVTESVWPYLASNPTAELKSNGLMKISKLSDGMTKFSDMLTALSRNEPLAFTFSTTNPFMGNYGVLRVHSAESGFAHAVAAVGIMYDERFEGGGLLILKNSWGVNYGDNGYVYMPFAYCKYHDCYAWSVKSVQIKGNSPGPTPNPNSDNLDFKTVVKYAGNVNGHQDFSLELEASEAALKQVESVLYDIHPSFRSYANYSATDYSDHFSTLVYNTYASNWQTGGASVKLKSGKVIRLPGVLIKWGN